MTVTKKKYTRRCAWRCRCCPRGALTGETDQLPQASRGRGGFGGRRWRCGRGAPPLPPPLRRHAMGLDRPGLGVANSPAPLSRGEPHALAASTLVRCVRREGGAARRAREGAHTRAASSHPTPPPPAGRQMCGAPFPSRRRTRPRLPVRGLCRGARGRPCRARGREAARRPASPASPRLARRRCPKERRAADSARARLTPSRPLSPAPCGLDPSRAGYTPGAATR